MDAVAAPAVGLRKILTGKVNDRGVIYQDLKAPQLSMLLMKLHVTLNGVLVSNGIGHEVNMDACHGLRRSCK